MTEQRPPQPLPAVLPCWHGGADVPVEGTHAICPACAWHQRLTYQGEYLWDKEEVRR